MGLQRVGHDWATSLSLSMCNSGFPCGSAGKESACNAGDLGSIPGLGWSPGEGNGYPLQYSGLENSVDCISPWGLRVRQDWATLIFTFTGLYYRELPPISMLFYLIKQRRFSGFMVTLFHVFIFPFFVSNTHKLAIREYDSGRWKWFIPCSMSLSTVKSLFWHRSQSPSSLFLFRLFETQCSLNLWMKIVEMFS